MKPRNRIIPIISISGEQMVKTVGFKKPAYLGDPLNAIKIFNDKEADELLILDIRASKEGKKPNLNLIREMAGEAFMPVGYGGGIGTLDDAKAVFDCGIEKVILNSVARKTPNVISEIANKFGSQSVVVSLDYAPSVFGKLRPVFVSGSEYLKKPVEEWALEIQNLGAGEIILQNVQRDGTFEGYDSETLGKISSILSIPVVVCGGANGLTEMANSIELYGASGAAAGSIFVFRNNNRESILISYKK